MASRNSGLIDLFAIQEEALAARASVQPPPSTPPPGVSFDIGGDKDDSDVDVFAAAQARTQRRTKIIGAAIGGLALLGILAIASGSSSGTKPAEPVHAAAVAPPTPAAVIPEPAPAPAPPPVTPPPASTEKGKPDYTRATAAAAGKKKAPIKVGAGRVPGVKLQKVHSGGTGR